MFLGIEIGGTKLQLGIGAGDGTLVAIERLEVQPKRGAQGILQQLEKVGGELVARHAPSAVGLGFGGPVDPAAGVAIKSHHVAGWEQFALADWCRQVFALPAAVENDCDAAALAEARFGAGRGHRAVLYVTVGSGIGGGLVLDREIYRGSGRGAAEIGHLRPGLLADRPDQTVESLASGWGIAAAAQSRLGDPISHSFLSLANGPRDGGPEQVRRRLVENEGAEAEYAADLRERCDGNLENLSARMVAQAAADGNEIARGVLAHACQVLGWAIAQALTLVSAEVVVVGGGVSLADESLFLAPLRTQVERYVFPPLAGTYEIVPAQLGEQVVVHGALAAASTVR
ncbi:MAG: ROK family protein [Planctomycetota bacterium]|nr:MAG: ROK family protein [Planctomycetota bacterium]